MSRLRTPAIRIRSLGKYFGPPLEMDGVARPREAWQSLMRIAGFDVRTAGEDEVQRTVAAPGQVLRDLSLDIEWGSVVCLAGASGSGKSVLLQILAGTIPPTTGCAELYGPVTSLVSVGDNFDTRLTAHENIHASAAVVDATPEEPARFASEVIDFAELHDFEHVPIRTYSSGMVLRLSVALALCGRPSIVLIDDVLAVGDIAFQQKCIDRVRALKEAGCTLVVAFSDDEVVQQIATRVITLGGGRILADEPPRHWATARAAGGAAAVEWHVAESLPESDVTALRSISVLEGRDGDDVCLDVELAFDVKTPGLRCRPSVILVRGRTVVFRSLYPEFVTVRQPGGATFAVRLPTASLPDGEYALTISMAAQQGTAVYSLKATDAITLAVRRGSEPAAEAGPGPMLLPALRWEIERLVEVPA